MLQRLMSDGFKEFLLTPHMTEFIIIGSTPNFSCGQTRGISMSNHNRVIEGRRTTII